MSTNPSIQDFQSRTFSIRQDSKHVRNLESLRKSGSILSTVKSTSLRRLRLVSKRAIQDRDDFHILLFGSFCLCFNASFVNLVTFSSYLKLATAHVTGLVARASQTIADGAWQLVYLPITVFLCFLVGSVVGGYTVSHETFYLGRSYGRALLTIALLQGSALVVNKVHVDEGHVQHYYIYVCAVAMGLQNSLTSKYSGNTLRTTHVTGATTDLGIAIGHLLKGRRGDLWKVKLHSTAILGFLVGGVMGRLAYLRFEETALLFNVTIMTVLGLSHLLWISRRKGLSLWKVFKSTTDLKVHIAWAHEPSPNETPTSPAEMREPTSRLASSGTKGASASVEYSRTVSLLALERPSSSRLGDRPISREISASFKAQSSISTSSSAKILSLQSFGDAQESCGVVHRPANRSTNLECISGQRPSPCPTAGTSNIKASCESPRIPPSGSGGVDQVGAHCQLPSFPSTMSGSPPRVIQVEAEVHEEDEDASLDDSEDVDEYSVGDVAGEVSCDDYDLVRDPLDGRLVEVLVRVDEAAPDEPEPSQSSQQALDGWSQGTRHTHAPE